MQDHAEAVYGDAMDSQKDIQTFSLVPNSSKKFSKKFQENKNSNGIDGSSCYFGHLANRVCWDLYLYISLIVLAYLCKSIYTSYSVSTTIFTVYFYPSF